MAFYAESFNLLISSVPAMDGEEGSEMQKVVSYVIHRFASLPISPLYGQEYLIRASNWYRNPLFRLPSESPQMKGNAASDRSYDEWKGASEASVGKVVSYSDGRYVWGAKRRAR